VYNVERGAGQPRKRQKRKCGPGRHDRRRSGAAGGAGGSRPWRPPLPATLPCAIPRRVTLPQHCGDTAEGCLGAITRDKLPQLLKVGWVRIGGMKVI
jgi:hypothetical protein